MDWTDLVILLNTFLAPDFENEIKKETRQDSKASIEEPNGASLGRITNHKRAVPK